MIETFTQLPNEKFHEVWDRFKEAIRKCPTHGIQKHRLIQYFYCGLSHRSRNNMDSSCGCYVQDTREDDAWRIIERMSESSWDFASHETFNRNIKSNHVHKVGDEENMGIMCAQMDKQNIFNKQIMETLNVLKENLSKPQPLMGVDGENLTNDVNWVQRNNSNPYSST